MIVNKQTSVITKAPSGLIRPSICLLHVKLASQEKCLYDAGITCVVIVVQGAKWNREANEVTSPYLDILCGTETTKDKNVQASPMNENNSPTIN